MRAKNWPLSQTSPLKARKANAHKKGSLAANCALTAMAARGILPLSVFKE